ncbi:hypothetical protein PF003_g33918 [Phytophthora fragariae]|nr:hypothetical protein PF003_g33918 [Phytophthora fragariae]
MLTCWISRSSSRKRVPQDRHLLHFPKRLCLSNGKNVPHLSEIRPDVPSGVRPEHLQSCSFVPWQESKRLLVVVLTRDPRCGLSRKLVGLSLPAPVTWNDLRLDDQQLMLTGIYFQGALDWLGEDRPVHTCFYREDLVEMLDRMMFWNKLNDSYWSKYVPERYYLSAGARLDDLVEQGIQQPFWRELVPSAVLDAKVLLEESGSGQDDASEESAWSDAGKASSEDDADDMKVSISAENSSHRRKRSSSPVSVPDQPPAKRSRQEARRDNRSPLAQKKYSKLTADEKTVVETPGDGVTSWRCHGVRVKHSDPSCTKG